MKGLLRASFTNYLQYIILQLNYPDLKRGKNEGWEDHLSCLEQHHNTGHIFPHEYRTAIRLLNAADYGVPQRRERIFIVGFRSDLHTEWNFPKPTHTEDALIWAKWITGSYWDEHGISKRHRPKPTAYENAQATRIVAQYGMFGPPSQRWRTVRDAIANLSDSSLNHEIRAGARCYPGHTGSYIDEPAKTLKAGDHGVPGGENMIRYPDDAVRYFSVRESCRLQTFPDDFFISGSWTEGMRQIGNAVPVKLAKVVGHSVYLHLDAALNQTAST